MTCSLHRLLCNTLIQPHYDYACSAWYPSLNKRLVKKIQISQNKCIRYCLELDNRAHIGANEFKEINWLPTKERVSQCICVTVFKFFNNMAPDYTSGIFHPSHSRHNTRMSTYKLDLPFRKSVYGKKTLSYLGPKTWNSLPAQIKLCKNVNSFKHDIKNLYFKRLLRSDDSISYVLLAKQSHITFCLLITFSLLSVQSTFVLHIPQGTKMKIRSMQTCIMSSLPRCIFRCSVFRYVTLDNFFQTLLFNCIFFFILVANKYLLTYLVSFLRSFFSISIL